MGPRADKGLEENNNIAIPMGLVVNKKMIDELKKSYKLTKEMPYRYRTDDWETVDELLNLLVEDDFQCNFQLEKKEEE